MTVRQGHERSICRAENAFARARPGTMASARNIDACSARAPTTLRSPTKHPALRATQHRRHAPIASSSYVAAADLLRSLGRARHLRHGRVRLGRWLLRPVDLSACGRAAHRLVADAGVHGGDGAFRPASGPRLNKGVGWPVVSRAWTQNDDRSRVLRSRHGAHVQVSARGALARAVTGRVPTGQRGVWTSDVGRSRPSRPRARCASLENCLHR